MSSTRRNAEAEQLLLDSVRIREQVQGAHHPDLVRTLHSLAELYFGQKRFAEAGPVYGRALAIAEARLDPRNTSDLTIVLGSYANLLKATGRGKERVPIFWFTKELLRAGCYALATPFFATEYTFNHMLLDPSLRAQVSMGY